MPAAVRVFYTRSSSPGRVEAGKGVTVHAIDGRSNALGRDHVTQSDTMRFLVLLLVLVWAPLAAQEPPPPFLYIYRDSLKAGVDSVYRVIENDGAQICADHHCPNPYVGLESLSGSHEAWWVNAFATPADTLRVAHVYATDQALATALGRIAQRKAALIGTPVQGFAAYRPDLSRGPAWSIVGARFVVVTVTKARGPSDGTVWMMADSTMYVLRGVHTLREADAFAHGTGARVFAVRPNWSMPATTWVAADPAFWRAAPIPKRY